MKRILQTVLAVIAIVCSLASINWYRACVLRVGDCPFWDAEKCQ